MQYTTIGMSLSLSFFSRTADSIGGYLDKLDSRNSVIRFSFSFVDNLSSVSRGRLTVLGILSFSYISLGNELITIPVFSLRTVSSESIEI